MEVVGDVKLWHKVSIAVSSKSKILESPDLPYGSLHMDA